MKRGDRIRNKIESVFTIDARYVGVLDGVRALAVLCVLWFHFWQQTWLMPVYETPFLKWMGVARINPDVLRRVGYLFVDVMLLLSAFLLYLPYARNRFCGTQTDRLGIFFRKRFARIAPSYLFAVIVMFLFALMQGVYDGKTDFAIKDILTHLTFTQMLFNDTYLFTGITAVMWTICVEVAFYLIFPLLAKAFRLSPLPVYATMMLAGIWFANDIAPAIGEPRVMVNRFLTFLPVFANGMMAAHIYVWYAEKVRHKMIPSIIGTVAAAAGIYATFRMFHACAAEGVVGNQQVWQMQYRAPLSLAFAVSILGLSVSAKPIRKLFDNRVLGAIAAVSYNLYLWHQWLMIRICSAFGAKSGADIARAGVNTQWTVTITGLAAAFAAAAVLTYGLERTVSKMIIHTRRKMGDALYDEGK